MFVELLKQIEAHFETFNKRIYNIKTINIILKD